MKKSKVTPWFSKEMGCSSNFQKSWHILLLPSKLKYLPKTHFWTLIDLKTDSFSLPKCLMDANYGSDLHVLWKDASLIDSPPFSHLPDRLLWTREEYLKKKRVWEFSQICIRPRANICPALSIRNLTFVRLEWCDSGNQTKAQFNIFP